LGTGFASLGELHRLPVDFAKIDRVLVQAVLCDDASLTVVRAIVRMARQNGAATVADVVERVEQTAWLKEWAATSPGVGCSAGRWTSWCHRSPHLCGLD
jgi:EAL domain-containing protein (putative c-di-GMP-specific phosphodiesterase class I)